VSNLDVAAIGRTLGNANGARATGVFLAIVWALLAPSLVLAGVLLFRRRTFGFLLGTALAVFGAVYQLNLRSRVCSRTGRTWRREGVRSRERAPHADVRRRLDLVVCCWRHAGGAHPQGRHKKKGRTWEARPFSSFSSVFSF
jgi:hypothetical protein